MVFASAAANSHRFTQFRYQARQHSTVVDPRIVRKGIEAFAMAREGIRSSALPGSGEEYPAVKLLLFPYNNKIAEAV